MEFDVINVPLMVTRRQALALGWKSGKKIAARDEIRSFVNNLFKETLKTGIEAEYRAYKQALKS